MFDGLWSLLFVISVVFVSVFEQPCGAKTSWVWMLEVLVWCSISWSILMDKSNYYLLFPSLHYHDNFKSCCWHLHFLCGHSIEQLICSSINYFCSEAENLYLKYCIEATSKACQSNCVHEKPLLRVSAWLTTLIRSFLRREQVVNHMCKVEC